MHPPRKPDLQPPPDGPRIRPVTDRDLPALLRLEEGFPGDRMSLRQFHSHLRSPRATLRVIEDGGPAGYCLLLRHAQRPAWRLYSIVVDSAWRGRGLGSRLLQDAIALARAAGAPALTLEVRKDNTAALALYRAHGFTQTAIRLGYYEDGATAVCLRLDL
jgi:ribosomal protein S18 acetylase RimI-like enzyme